LRRVLLHRAWMYLHGSGRPASASGDWKTINDAATKKALESKMNFSNCPAHKRDENTAHTAAVKQAGGYLELQAALAYRAWYCRGFRYVSTKRPRESSAALQRRP
jgi:hypothetical protein